jgi:hypothetical protein
MLTNLTSCIVLILDKVIIFILKKRVIKMITKQIIFKTLAIASFSFITSCTVFANSNNNQSIFPLKWQFSKNLHSKNERNLSYASPKLIVGLNTFDQKKFNHYGIQDGNKFISTVENIDVIFKNNSAGLKITVEKNYGELIILRYMDKENLDKINLNKVTVENNI